MNATFNYNPNAQYLFKRTWSVAIGPTGQPAAKQYNSLRTRFDIDKTAVGSSNKSKIEIFNLSSQSRTLISKGYSIKLTAGYNGLNQTLFVGNIVNVQSGRDGPDIITSMECGDGEQSIIFATFDKSYPAQSTLVQIVQDLANAMGVGAGIALGIPSVVYNKGFVASGTVSDSLNKLLANQNLEWHVQNGNLNIIPQGAYNGQSAIVVSQNTGMIGVPSDNLDFVQFSNLLNPKLVPGALIQLISENVSLNGFKTIRRSHFEGDSHDKKWQVACEAIKATGVQALVPAQGFNYQPAVVKTA